MKASSQHEVTQLLIDWGKGDQAALDQLLPLIYQDLHQIAGGYLSRERPGHTIQPTALIHEAYLRLVAQQMPEWQNRKHFFGVTAQLMRQILVEHARAHAAAKRGAGEQHLPLDEALAYSTERPGDLVALDDALLALAAFDQRKSRMVELRFFGGLSLAETAEVMGVSVPTVVREITAGSAGLQHRWRLADSYAGLHEALAAATKTPQPNPTGCRSLVATHIRWSNPTGGSDGCFSANLQSPPGYCRPAVKHPPATAHWYLHKSQGR